MSTGKPVDLGFAEECEPWLLTNRYFPSKIGNKPAWLDLKELPTAEQIECPHCQEPRVFLCQIYAPVQGRDDCFHRTIFVFICRNEQCNVPNSASNILALRSQLGQTNEFYSAEPPNEEDKLGALPCVVKLCSVCGCRGPLTCSRCKKTTYCSKKHQKIDWKHHKLICNETTTTSQEGSENHSEVIFPEFEIVIEADEGDVADAEEMKESEEEAEKRRLAEFEQLTKEGKTGELKDISDTELAKYTAGAEEIIDKQFKKFKKITSREPDQIIRYDRSGSPLWITDVKTEIPEIPNCELCGEKRDFEFQIMPQMLNELNVTNIDWGVIAIYTCSKSCSVQGKGYVREFVVKQDIVA